jgi:hypothetical protein
MDFVSQFVDATFEPGPSHGLSYLISFSPIPGVENQDSRFYFCPEFRLPYSGEDGQAPKV